MTAPSTIKINAEPSGTYADVWYFSFPGNAIESGTVHRYITADEAEEDGSYLSARLFEKHETIRSIALLHKNNNDIIAIQLAETGEAPNPDQLKESIRVELAQKNPLLARNTSAEASTTQAFMQQAQNVLDSDERIKQHHNNTDLGVRPVVENYDPQQRTITIRLDGHCALNTCGIAFKVTEDRITNMLLENFPEQIHRKGCKIRPGQAEPQ